MQCSVAVVIVGVRANETRLRDGRKISRHIGSDFLLGQKLVIVGKAITSLSHLFKLVDKRLVIYLNSREILVSTFWWNAMTDAHGGRRHLAGRLVLS